MFSSEPADIPFADRRLAMLQRLAELGMVMAEKLAAAPEVTAETAMQFARVSKAVRQTLALEAHLSSELNQARAAEAEAARELAHDRRKRTIVRTVERIIEAEPKENDWELGEAFDDWRDRNEDEAFDLDRPFGEILAEICKALDIAPDLSAFDDEPWIAEALAAGLAPADPAPPGAVRKGELLAAAAHARPPDG